MRYLSAGAGAQIVNAVRLKGSAIRKRFGNVAIGGGFSVVAGGTRMNGATVAVTLPFYGAGSNIAAISDVGGYEITSSTSGVSEYLALAGFDVEVDPIDWDLGAVDKSDKTIVTDDKPDDEDQNYN